MNDGIVNAESRDACASPWRGRLSEYLDGELSAGETAAVDAHLAVCGHCAAVVADFASLVSQARALNRPSEPERDLWPAVRVRLAPRRSALGWLGWRGWLPVGLPVRRVAVAAAAVVALVVAAIGGTVWLVVGPAESGPEALAGRPTQGVDVTLASRGPGRTGSPAREGPDRTPEVAVRSGADPRVLVSGASLEYDDTFAGLRRDVREALAADPKVVEALERNLARLDQAIAECEDALAEHPGDARLTARVAAARQRKVDLLRQAVTLATDPND